MPRKAAPANETPEAKFKRTALAAATQSVNGLKTLAKIARTSDYTKEQAEKIVKLLNSETKTTVAALEAGKVAGETAGDAPLLEL